MKPFGLLQRLKGEDCMCLTDQKLGNLVSGTQQV